MTTKEAVIEMIRRLPDDATLDDIVDEIYVRQKIEEGLRDSEEGRVISHEEVKKTKAREYPTKKS